jgi:PilZ domain
MVNRRFHIRKEIHLAMEIITEDNIYLGISDDISKGGLALELDGPIYENQKIQLGVFKVLDGFEDDTPALGINGTVAWSRIIEPGKFQAGIRFIDLETQEESYLAHLIDL